MNYKKMKKEKRLLSVTILILSIFLAFASSCKKKENEEGDDVYNEGNSPDGPSSGSFTDSRDGNVYNWVTIGDQVWMAENLKYLPSVVGPETESETIPYYYVYDYNGTNVSQAKATANYNNYGVLYNWPAAMAGSSSSSSNPSGIQCVCPTGWHLPSDAEWTELTDYLGGEAMAGGKLKESGTSNWFSPNTGATNETGFTALPGGYRDYSGNPNDFRWKGYTSFWWSSTEYTSTSAWMRNMTTQTEGVESAHNGKLYGYSVRCVKD